MVVCYMSSPCLHCPVQKALLFIKVEDKLKITYRARTTALVIIQMASTQPNVYPYVV